jgi:hypothetical protein
MFKNNNYRQSGRRRYLPGAAFSDGAQSGAVFFEVRAIQITFERQSYFEEFEGAGRWKILIIFMIKLFLNLKGAAS